MRTTTWILATAFLVAPGCILMHEDANDRCPASMPQDGGFCSGSDTCTYGGLACQCGRPCQPAYGCQCVDGRWMCWHTDPIACPDEGVMQDAHQDAPLDPMVDPGQGCPLQEPLGTGGCSQQGLVCQYGTECCCGQCHPAMVCECFGNGWGCYATDACMIPACPDVIEDIGFPPDGAVGADVPEPLSDASSDAAVDVSFPDVTVPPCCAKNADCGPGWVCGTRGGSANGTCKPEMPFGHCWSEEDCATGSTCLGVVVCPCNADCDGMDQPGTCTSMPQGCCWTDSDCSDGTVCRAQGGLGGLPGSCVPDPLGPACTGDSACCWNDADCFGAGTCSGAIACGCIELCPMCGACMPDQMGMCAM